MKMKFVQIRIFILDLFIFFFSGIFRNYLMWMHGIGIMWKAQVVIYGLTFCLIVVTSVKNPDKPSEYHCTVERF